MIFFIIRAIFNRLSFQCLIPLEELRRLRSIEAKWNTLHKDNPKLADGKGQICSKSDQSEKVKEIYDEVIDTSDDNSKLIDNRVIGHEVSDPIIFDSGEPDKPTKSFTKDSSELSDDLILSKVRKRYHQKCKRLLQALHNLPLSSFSIDSLGIISIDSVKVPGKL